MFVLFFIMACYRRSVWLLVRRPKARFPRANGSRQLHFFKMAHRSRHGRAHYVYSQCELNNGRWSFRERERGSDNGSRHVDDVHQGERARFEGERDLGYRASGREGFKLRHNNGCWSCG